MRSSHELGSLRRSNRQNRAYDFCSSTSLEDVFIVGVGFGCRHETAGMGRLLPSGLPTGRESVIEGGNRDNRVAQQSVAVPIIG